MQKQRSGSEVYNDIDNDIVNIFRVLQNPEKRRALQEKLSYTPYSRAEFELAYQKTDDDIEAARRLLIRSFMGYSSGAASGLRTGFRAYTVDQYTAPEDDWANYPGKLNSFAQRLRGVIIESRPAIQVIERYDNEDTLFYIDPPYVFSTRYKPGSYRYEMPDSEHEQLLNVILALKGMALISGYENEIYSRFLRGWKCVKTDSRISANKGSKIKTEVLWISPHASARINNQFGLFAPPFISKALNLLAQLKGF